MCCFKIYFKKCENEVDLFKVEAENNFFGK